MRRKAEADWWDSSDLRKEKAATEHKDWLKRTVVCYRCAGDGNVCSICSDKGRVVMAKKPKPPITFVLVNCPACRGRGRAPSPAGSCGACKGDAKRRVPVEPQECSVCDAYGVITVKRQLKTCGVCRGLGWQFDRREAQQNAVNSGLFARKP